MRAAINISVATNNPDKYKYVPVADVQLFVFFIHASNSERSRSVSAVSWGERFFVCFERTNRVMRLNVPLTVFLKVVHEVTVVVPSLLPPMARLAVIGGPISFRTVYSILAMVSRARVRWRLGLVHSCK